MKIIDKRVYTGKNIHSHKLCIRLTVDVENLCDTPTKDIEGLNENMKKGELATRAGDLIQSCPDWLPEGLCMR